MPQSANVHDARDLRAHNYPSRIVTHWILHKSGFQALGKLVVNRAITKGRIAMMMNAINQLITGFDVTHYRDTPINSS